MTSGRTECALAVVALLSVLMVFFFPALQGPYPAIHGPVTALLSLRAAARLRLGIMRNGLKAICSRVSCARATLPSHWYEFSLSGFEPNGSLIVCGSVLRC